MRYKLFLFFYFLKLKYTTLLLQKKLSFLCKWYTNLKWGMRDTLVSKVNLNLSVTLYTCSFISEFNNFIGKYHKHKIKYPRHFLI